MRPAPRSPAVVKLPAQNNEGPPPLASSCTIIVSTKLFMPVPSGCHALPSHFAMRFVGVTPTLVNQPAANNCGPAPVRSSNAASVRTSMFMPAPTGAHAAPFQRAMRTAAAGPADVKFPPT
jgi:hypothetical protein